jgi:ABC-type lipoprotein export system ATPase subunit
MSICGSRSWAGTDAPRGGDGTFGLPREIADQDGQMVALVTYDPDITDRASVLVRMHDGRLVRDAGRSSSKAATSRISR